MCACAHATTPLHRSTEKDYSANNGIIDRVAWQSNFNVVVPSKQKFRVMAHNGQVSCIRYVSKPPRTTLKQLF